VNHVMTSLRSSVRMIAIKKSGRGHFAMKTCQPLIETVTSTSATRKYRTQGKVRWYIPVGLILCKRQDESLWNWGDWICKDAHNLLSI
jgi:hypothetical protein